MLDVICQDESMVVWVPNMQPTKSNPSDVNIYYNDTDGTNSLFCISDSNSRIRSELFEPQKGSCASTVKDRSNSFFPITANRFVNRSFSADSISSSADDNRPLAADHMCRGSFRSDTHYKNTYDVPRRDVCSARCLERPTKPTRTPSTTDPVGQELRVSLYNNVGSLWVNEGRTTSPYDIKAEAENTLNDCAFYYGSLSKAGASARLKPCSEGSYLLRNSSQENYAYCLSVKTSRGITSVRISYDDGLYHLDTAREASDVDGFSCVLELVAYYADTNNRYVFLERCGRKNTPLYLNFPVIKDSVLH